MFVLTAAEFLGFLVIPVNGRLSVLESLLLALVRGLRPAGAALLLLSL